MKQLIRNLNTPHIIALGIMLGISVFILLVSPLIKIHNQYPLMPLEKRLYLIALIILVYILFFLLSPQQKKSTLAPSSPEVSSKLQALQQRFQGAVDFLKKTFIAKHGKNVSLAQLPWFLLIGPSGAGKTTLLANANINYVLTKQFKQEKIAASSSFDWWATRDLVLVDAAGIYLKEKNRFLWDSFLKLSAQLRGKNAINTVIIALPLPELIKQQNASQKKQIAAEIKHAIVQLEAQFGKELNFYFILTKCDQLPGFLEFFGDSGTDELAQAWGITLPTRTENEKLLDVFAQRFNALIKRLNTQLIARLHQERNSNARPAIKDFPLQVERLKENMLQFLKALSLPNLKLHGVYLTSATQSNTEEQGSQTQIINGNAHQALQLLRNPPLPTKSYFIRQLLLQALFSNADQHATSSKLKTSWRKYAAYAFSIGLVIFIAALLGRDFQQSVLQTYAIQNSLSQYRFAISQPNQQDVRLLKALPLLNALQASALQTGNNLSKIKNLLSFYSDKSQKTATLFYQQALQTIALPEIKNSFENYLNNPNNKNPTQIYSVLKAYLMLGDFKNLDVDYVTNVTKQLFLTSLNKQSTEELSAHIKTAFSQTSKPLTLDKKLIEQIRGQLTQLPSQDLALVILRNLSDNNEDSAINLEAIGNSSAFISNQSFSSIPNFFTEKNFKTVLSETNLAATEALQGNWIIGDAEILSNEATIKVLAQQIRVRYITNYVATWEGLLTQLRLIKPTTLAQTDAVIATLMSNTSPLLQLLQTIKQNTSAELILAASPKLHALNNLLANADSDQENILYQIFIHLRQLHFYLQGILNATDVSQASFEATKNRTLNPINDPITKLRIFADQNPEPMKSWLINIATQSWETLLEETSHHIENAWEVNILPVYQAQFGNNEDHEMDLQQVANFIGKQGTLANFYSRYLKPFVNDTAKPWQWRVIDNKTLPFDISVLEQIQQASKLQNLSRYMLFTQGRNNPALRQLQLPERLLADKD